MQSHVYIMSLHRLTLWYNLRQKEDSKLGSVKESSGPIVMDRRSPLVSVLWLLWYLIIQKWYWWSINQIALCFYWFLFRADCCSCFKWNDQKVTIKQNQTFVYLFTFNFMHQLDIIPQSYSNFWSKLMTFTVPSDILANGHYMRTI